MELLEKAIVVRLRSHHNKYLIAEDDQVSICQDRDGRIKTARWTVEISESGGVIRLQSCYGKYLTASNVPFLLGMSGKKVQQTIPKRLDSSVEWEPIRKGGHVRFKTRYGQYLRANGGLPPWRNSVTHDIPHRTATQDWVLWEVQILMRVPPPPVAPPPQQQNEDDDDDECSSPEIFSLKSPVMTNLEFDDCGSSAAKHEGRFIYYQVADENGTVNEDVEEKSFTFKGMGVKELKEKMEEETGLDELEICSRNPLNGKLYPLRLHLPPNNAKMHVVVIPLSSKVATEDQVEAESPTTS